MTSSNSGNQSKSERPSKQKRLNKSLPIMVSSVVAIAMIAISFSACTKSEQKDTEATSVLASMDHPGLNPRTAVLFATRDIKTGDVITSDDVEERITNSFKQPYGAVRSRSMVVGRKANYDVKKGTYVIENLTAQASPTPSDNFEKPADIQYKRAYPHSNRELIVVALRDASAGETFNPENDLEERKPERTEALPDDALSSKWFAEGYALKRNVSRKQIVSISDFDNYPTVIAGTNISKGETILKESLELIDLPYKLPYALDEKALVGRVALCDIKAGYVIRSEYLKPRK